MVKHAQCAFLLAYDSTRDANYGRVIRNGFHDHRTCPDLDAIADLDSAENLGSRANHDFVPNCRMAFAAFMAGPTKRDSLINENVIANFGGLANDHAHAMIDKKAVADCCPRMDFNPSQKTGKLRHETRQDGYTRQIQTMRHAMHKHGMEARITKDNFEDTAGGGILTENGFDLFANYARHF